MQLTPSNSYLKKIPSPTGPDNDFMNRLDKNASSSLVEKLPELQFSTPFGGNEAAYEPVCRSSLFVPMHYEKGYSYPLIVWLSDTGKPCDRISRVMPKISLRNYFGVAPFQTTSGSTPSFDEFEDANFDMALMDSESFNEQMVEDFLDEEFADEELMSGQQDPDSQASMSVPSDPDLQDEAIEKMFSSIEEISLRYNICPDRIFLAGTGEMADLAAQTAVRHSNSFAGLILLGGSMPDQEKLFGDLRAARRLPVFIGQSRDDANFSEDQLCDTLKMLHVAGFSATARQYPGSERMHERMLHDIDVWVMELINGFDMTRTESPVSDQN